MRRLKNRYGVSPMPAPRPALARPAKANVPRPFEEEVALLREEQVEARQVDLLLVDLDLREVGVDGEVGGDVLRDAVLHVAADAAVAIVVDARRHGVDRSRRRRARYGLSSRLRAARRHLQALEVAGRRDLQQAAERRQRARHLREVRPLVLPAHDAAQVDAPRLIGARAGSAAT